MNWRAYARAPNVFFEFELLGTVFLFAGFYLSDRFITNREALKVKSSKGKNLTSLGSTQ